MRTEISPYDYVSYSSDEWRSVRDWILDRDFHTCQICGSKKNLCVHHKIYDDEKEIWDYMDEDLITLCKDCHDDVHLDFGPVYPHWSENQYYESRYYKQRLNPREPVNIGEMPERLQRLANTAVKKFKP